MCLIVRTQQGTITFFKYYSLARLLLIGHNVECISPYLMKSSKVTKIYEPKYFILLYFHRTHPGMAYTLG